MGIEQVQVQCVGLVDAGAAVAGLIRLLCLPALGNACTPLMKPGRPTMQHKSLWRGRQDLDLPLIVQWHFGSSQCLAECQGNGFRPGMLHTGLASRL